MEKTPTTQQQNKKKQAYCKILQIVRQKPLLAFLTLRQSINLQVFRAIYMQKKPHYDTFWESCIHVSYTEMHNFWQHFKSVMYNPIKIHMKFHHYKSSKVTYTAGYHCCDQSLSHDHKRSFSHTYILSMLP